MIKKKTRLTIYIDIIECVIVIMSLYFSRMMKSLEVERVRSRAAGDRDSDTIIDLRTALEIERELRNAVGGKLR